MAVISLKINGKTPSIDIDQVAPVLWVLRDHLYRLLRGQANHERSGTAKKERKTQRRRNQNRYEWQHLSLRDLFTNQTGN